MPTRCLAARFAVALCCWGLSATWAAGSPENTRLLHDLSADLSACRRDAQRTAEAGARDAGTGLLSCLDRIRAADLLLAAGWRDVEARLEKGGAAGDARARQSQVAAAYRVEFDAIYAFADRLRRARDAEDVSAMRLAAAELERHLAARLAPGGRRLLAQSVAHRSLQLPRAAASAGAPIVPAYLKTAIDPPVAADRGLDQPTAARAALVAQAVALQQEPIAIFEFVQNEIEVEFYHGVIKPPAETLRQRRGNDADQAALLVALLRASGVPARFVRGVATLTAAQAMAWTGMSTARRAADLFTRAGMPFDQVTQGGGIGAFSLDHTWVEAYVSYGNYRGVPLDTAGAAWIPLDPSWKRRLFSPGAPLPAGAGFTADAVSTAYLAAPQELAIEEYFRKRINDALLAADPSLSIDDVRGTFQTERTRTGLLPSTLPYEVKIVLDERVSLPDALQHRVRFVAVADGGNAFDVTVPATAIVGQRVTLSYVPATVEDQITANAFIGLDNTPAYLLRVRPVLKVGGVIRGAGERSLQMGALHEWRIEMQRPGGSLPIANTVVAGGFYSAAFGLEEVAYQPPLAEAPADTEHAAADLLFGRAAAYLDRWSSVERLLAGLLRVVPVHPVLNMAIVGNEYRRTVVFGQPQSLEWRGVFVDADLRVTEPVPIEGVDALRPEFMRLSGLAGSALEAEVLHDFFEVDAVSATRLLQLARAAATTIHRVDAGNASAIVPALATAEEVKTHILDAVHQGLVATVPAGDAARNIWSGIGYILEDPATGEGGYFISGALAGGMTTDDPDEWVRQQYVDSLGNPNAPNPNTNSTAAFSLTKLDITDKQDGTVNEPLDRDLAVWVRDAEGLPVSGADVVFKSVAGGARFNGDNETTVQTNNLGVARVNPTLGKKTGDAPFYVQKPNDQYPTQVGNNLITASVSAAGGDISLETPFQVFAYPGDPHHVIKVIGDNNNALVGTGAGTLKARLVDEFDNPISNRQMTFTVLDPGINPGTPRELDPGPGPSFRNLVIFPREPRCPVAVPLLGDCNGTNEVRLTTSVFGAAVDTILGNDFHSLLEGGLRLFYRVSATVEDVDPQTFRVNAYSGPTFPLRFLTANMAGMQLINDRGERLDSTKVGTAFPRPLSVSLHVTDHEYALERITPCEPPPPTSPDDPPRCFDLKFLYTVRSRPVDIAKPGTVTFPEGNGEATAPKEQESGRVEYEVTEGGGTMTPAVADMPDHNPGNGLYNARLTVGAQPALNKIEAGGSVHVWAPKIDLEHGTVEPVLVDLKVGQTLINITKDNEPLLTDDEINSYEIGFGVFGVRATIDEKNVLIGQSGGTVKDVTLDYKIEPDTYNAQLAQVDLFKHEPGAATGAQGDLVGIVPGEVTAGEGGATVYQGTGFDPRKRYRMQLVLNRGSEAEIKSDTEELGAYLASPFGSDFRAKRWIAENARKKRTIDLAEKLRNERATLQDVLKDGLDRAARSCSPLGGEGVLIIEQGSGACFWSDAFDRNPVGACTAFQPGVSDHDFEVFLPVTLAGPAECIVNELTDAADVDELGDVTFFYVPKEELLDALLNIDLPPFPIGSDEDGDLGFGRQTLLLGKILLEGEYVKGVADINVNPPSLDGLLEKLRTDPAVRIPGEATGIPRLEGYEQVLLQTYGFYKAGAHQRITGKDVHPKSQVFDLSQRGLRNAAKAAIRAAAGRLVADQDGNKLLFISRAAYRAGGCLTGTEDPANPRPILELFPKACDTFEEHVASAAVRSIRDNLFLFTEQQVRDIYDFYRVKADPPCAAEDCSTQIVDEVRANEFIAKALKFIGDMAQATFEVWDETLHNDPARQPKRLSNVTNAVAKTDAAKLLVSRVIHDRVFNFNGIVFEDVPLQLDSDAASQIVHNVRKIAEQSEQIIDVERDEDGEPKRNPANGDVIPIFKVKIPSSGQHHVTIFLDPADTIRECDKRDNYAGFFTYPFNPSDASVPPFPDRPPPPVTLPMPPPECAEDPLPQLTLTKLVNGQPRIRVVKGTKVTLSHTLANSGDVPVENILVEELLTGRVFGPFSLLPGASVPFETDYQTAADGETLIAPSEALGFAGNRHARAWDSVAVDVVSPPCDVVITSYDPDPNPVLKFEDPTLPPRPGSEVMQGGLLFRYYKVIDGQGAPVRHATVSLEVNGRIFTASTNGEGEIVHASTGDEDDPRGLQLAADAIGATGIYRARFLSVGANQSVCSPTFFVDVKSREFSRGYTAGAKIEAEATAAVGLEGKAGTGLAIGLDDRYNGTRSKLSLDRSVNGELGVQAGWSSPKARFTLPFAEAQLGAEAKATVAGTVMVSDTHEFTYPPNSNDLPPDQATAFGGLLVATVASASNANNPVVAKMLEAVIDRLTDFSAYRTTDSFAIGETVSGSLQGAALAGLTPIGKGNPADMTFGLGATGSISGSASAVVNVDYKRLAKELVPGYTLSASADLSFALGRGSISDELNEKRQKNELKLRDKLRFTFRAPFGASWRARLTLDENDGFKPTKLTITYSTPKGYGYKVEDKQYQPVSGGADADKHSINYTITDPDAIQEAIDALVSIATIGAIGAVTLPPPLGNPAILGPVLMIAEMIKLFEILGKSDATYDTSTKTGDGLSFPIGIELGAGAKVKVSAAISFDRSVGFATEKGVLKQGDTFPLERYTRDSYLPVLQPNDASDLLELVEIGADAVGQAGSSVIDVVSKGVTDGINRIRSRFTAELAFEGASLNASEIALTSFTFTAIAGPVAPGAQRPADVSGRADLPHYGIGGFHHFTPEGVTLTAPATLTFFYRDEEVVGINESSLGIYLWNEISADWDFVGGTVDPAANTITTTVTRLGLYTAAPPMPGRTFTFTKQGTGTSATYTSSVIRMNTGVVVPDGTMFTVQALAPFAASVVPFGQITSPDEDPATDGVQITSHGGVINFTATYPAGSGAVRVLAFSTPGTALSDHIIPF